MSQKQKVKEVQTKNIPPMFRERWQRQQSLEVEEGEASMQVVEAATIRKLGLTLPVLPIQVI